VRVQDFFVNDEISLTILDTIAKRYGKLPSEIINSPMEDIQLDFLCTTMGIDNEIRAFKEAQKRKTGKTIVKTGYRKKYGR